MTSTLGTKLRFSAILEQGERYVIASSPEVPEANGQGRTREEALRDLAVSIRSILDYRREEGLAKAPLHAEKTVVVVP